jgi:hypothetical protein
VLAGAAAVASTHYHRKALEDYVVIRFQVEMQARLHTTLTPRLQELSSQQLDAYDDAQSAQRLAVAARIAVATLWAVNALDSALTSPQRGNGALTFGARSSREGILSSLTLRF